MARGAPHLLVEDQARGLGRRQLALDLGHGGLGLEPHEREGAQQQDDAGPREPRPEPHRPRPGEQRPPRRRAAVDEGEGDQKAEREGGDDDDPKDLHVSLEVLERLKQPQEVPLGPRDEVRGRGVRRLLEARLDQGGEKDQRHEHDQGRDRLSQGEVGEEGHPLGLQLQLLLLRPLVPRPDRSSHASPPQSGRAIPCFLIIAKCRTIPTARAIGRTAMWMA